MFCRNCGKAMNENQAICLGCGVKKGTGISFCEHCGSSVSSAAAVCLSCGAAIKNGGSVGNDLAGNSKATILVLCWFLGTLGIHNFVMGEAKRGLVKIIGLFVTLGIGSWILALIDFIKICTNSYEVDTEKFFY